MEDTVWLVLVEDRHDGWTDEADVMPFTSEDQAVRAASRLARGLAHRQLARFFNTTLQAIRDKAGSFPAGMEGDPAELTPEMREHGWVAWFPYGNRGDRVRVVRRALNPLVGP